MMRKRSGVRYSLTINSSLSGLCRKVVIKVAASILSTQIIKTEMNNNSNEAAAKMPVPIILPKGIPCAKNGIFLIEKT